MLGDFVGVCRRLSIPKYRQRWLKNVKIKLELTSLLASSAASKELAPSPFLVPPQIHQHYVIREIVRNDKDIFLVYGNISIVRVVEGDDSGKRGYHLVLGVLACSFRQKSHYTGQKQ